MRHRVDSSGVRGRREGVPFFLLGALLLAGIGGSTVRADDPEPLRIEASVSGPLGRSRPTTVTIEPDGTARMVQQRRWAWAPNTTVAFPLVSAEMEELRRLLVASRFFEPWGVARPVCDAPTWDVTVRLGNRELHRPNIYGQPEFEALERYLERFVRQMDATAELRGGRCGAARLLLVYGQDGRVPSPAALAAEIVACALGISPPDRCANAAVILVALPSTEDWVRSGRYLLARLEGDRRGAVLTAWAAELRRPERAAARAGFEETALAEIEGSWSLWPSRPSGEAAGGGAILAMLLRDRVPEAFDVAERMARTFGSLEEAVVPAGLLETGEAAVPVMLRLLKDSSPGARMSGAEMARRDAGIVRRKEGLSEALSEADLNALEHRYGEDVVPALERLVQNAAQPFAVRQMSLRALDRWDGRVEAAKAKAWRALKEERAKREAEVPPAPVVAVGTLSISGRLLGLSDAPLPGVRVAFARREGWCFGSAVAGDDGSFRVDGLAEGVYDALEETEPGQGLRGIQRGTLRLAEAITAGTRDLVLRVPGSMIRGRLLDPSGAPAVGRRILALMRDAPSNQGPGYSTGIATADGLGHFVILRLMPGVYDLEVLGHAAVRGVTAIEAGPTDRTIEMLAGAAIAGRVIDETGAPMAGLHVSAALPGPSWDPIETAQTAADGAVRLEHLDPARRYQVWASIGGGEEQRNAVANAVSTGTTDLTLRLDTTPHLRIRVDVGERGSSRTTVRLERVAGGPSTTRTFDGPVVLWRAALPGTWKVSAHVRDVDASGVTTYVWVDLGTATTGEPEMSFTVPR